MMNKNHKPSWGLFFVLSLFFVGCSAGQIGSDNREPIRATVTPSPNLYNPTATPTLLVVPLTWSQFHYFELFWSIPSTWQSVTEILSHSITERHLIYAATDIDNLTRPDQPLVDTADGMMLMKLQAGIEIPTLPELIEIDVSGQPGWLWETRGVAGEPDARQWTLFVQTLSNRYALSLDCLLPDRADPVEQQANYERLCQQIWDRMVAELAIEIVDTTVEECPDVLPTPAVGTGEWRRVHSGWNQYAFEVPVSWLEMRGPSPDRLKFLSDSAVYAQPNLCPLLHGIIVLEFGANRPGNFGDGSPLSGPDVAGFVEISVAEHPAWIQPIESEYSTIGTAVYIQGPEFWYHLWFYCLPPTGANEAEQEGFTAQCDEVTDHILNSFQIPEAD